MPRRVGSARAWKVSSCDGMYIHYHAYTGASSPSRCVSATLHFAGISPVIRRRTAASQPLTLATKSSNGVFSPRLTVVIEAPFGRLLSGRSEAQIGNIQAYQPPAEHR